jgi:hypothetical protein
METLYRCPQEIAVSDLVSDISRGRMGGSLLANSEQKTAEQGRS